MGTMDDDEAKRIDQEERQKRVNQAVRQVAHALHTATGNPPRAIIMVVHFQDDILFGAEMQAAPPQAQMNAVDKMIEQLRKCGEKLKAGINTARHKPPGTITQ
jgi:hypothetical protein